MKKHLPLILFAFVVLLQACDSNTAPTTEKKESNTTASAPAPVLHDYVRTDTLRFSKDSTRWVLIGLQKGERQADSTLKHALSVILYEGTQQRSVYESTLMATGEEELLHNFYVCGEEQQLNEHFFTVDFGYPACAYLQQHWLFSVDATGCHLITQYNSSSDSGYGQGTEFYQICNATVPADIQSVAYSSEPDEKQDNVLKMTYSDSVQYHFDGQQWTARAITPKGQVIRQATEPF